MDCVHEKMVQIHPPHPKNFCDLIFMYVHSHRRLVRGFLLFILHCALVAPVARGDIYIVQGPIGTNWQISAYFYTPVEACPATNIVATVEWSLDNVAGTAAGPFTTVSGSFTVNANTSANAAYQGPQIPSDPYAIVWTDQGMWEAGPNAAVGHLTVTINPAGGDGAVSQHTVQYFAQGILYPTNFVYGQPHTPCFGTSGKGLDASYVTGGITNTTGSPIEINGNILQPGQVLDVSGYTGLGSSNGTVLFPTEQLDPNNGIWVDGPSFTISNVFGAGGGSNYANTQVGLSGPVNNSGAFSDSLYTNSGGPIIWQASTLSNGPAAVDAAGFSDVANNQLLQDQLLSNLLSRPLTVQMGSNGFGGSASNVWVQNWPSNFNAASGGSNVFNGGSNVWVENWPWSNGIGGISNLLQGAFVTATNGGYSIMNPLTGAGGPAGSIEGGIPTTIADQPGEDDLGDVTVGNGASDSLTFALISFPTQMTQYYNELRGLISWCIIVGSLLWNCRFAFDCISEVLRTKGVQGMSTGPLTDQFGGWAIAGIMISAFLLALIVTIPVSIAGLLSGELSFLPSTTTATNFLSGANTSLLWVENFFPVWIFVSSCGFEIVFFFAVRGYCLLIQSAIRLIPGA